MRIFDFTENLERALKVVFIVLSASVALVWLNQNPLARYWEQTYHQPAPWAKLQGHYAWDLGGYLQDGVIAAGETMVEYARGNHVIEETEKAIPGKRAFPEEFQTGLHFINGYLYPASALSVTFPELLNRGSLPAGNSVLKLDKELAAKQILAKKTPKSIIELEAGDKVFFVGDSLMQGVAPVLQSRLTKAYGIESINLSKQSTGLTYLKFFNWPEIVRTTLAANPDIRLMVVFLGPNDPWDMPPDGGGRYLRFTSPEWEEQYRKRIQDILLTARIHDVDVIWISPPNMRKGKLSDGVHYLSGLYQSEIKNAGEIWLSANTIFKYQDQIYSDYIGDGSSNIKLRSGDGIHFTYKGQKAIADTVFDLIKFNAAPQEPEVQEETHNETTKTPVVAP